MFVTYLTIYKGNKLPPFYIGSTSMKKHKAGYHGSVLSKAYKEIYKQELLEYPELFDSCIISEHETREEATKAERLYQIQVDAARNPLFMNKSIAAPKGFFGLSLPKEEHPLYGSHNGKGNIHSYHPETLEQVFLPEIPEGFIKGRSPNYKASSHNKGRKWYNNGIDNKMCIIGSEPDGWVMGKIARNKGVFKTTGLYEPEINARLYELWLEEPSLPFYKFEEKALAKGFPKGNYSSLVYNKFRPKYKGE